MVKQLEVQGQIPMFSLLLKIFESALLKFRFVLSLRLFNILGAMSQHRVDQSGQFMAVAVIALPLPRRAASLR